MRKSALILAGILGLAGVGEVYGSGRSRGTSQKPKATKIIPQEIRKKYDFSKDSEETLLARMIYGEARNCSYDEKITVGFTAVNRANDGKRWNGTSVSSAILTPYQYSCFNKNDPNRELLKGKLSRPVWDECVRAARAVLSGDLVDPFENTHYHTRQVSPRWSGDIKMEKRIDNPEFKHIFYGKK